MHYFEAEPHNGNTMSTGWHCVVDCRRIELNYFNHLPKPFMIDMSQQICSDNETLQRTMGSVNTEIPI